MLLALTSSTVRRSQAPNNRKAITDAIVLFSETPSCLECEAASGSTKVAGFRHSAIESPLCESRKSRGRLVEDLWKGRPPDCRNPNVAGAASSTRSLSGKTFNPEYP